MAITDITKVNKTNTDLIIPIFECKGSRESNSKEHLISSSHLLAFSPTPRHRVISLDTAPGVRTRTLTSIHTILLFSRAYCKPPSAYMHVHNTHFKNTAQFANDTTDVNGTF